MPDFALPDDTFRALLKRDKAALAEQSAAGQGYVLTPPNIQHTYDAPMVALGDFEMARQVDPNANTPYIPEEDVIETNPVDGRATLVAAKGVPVPYARAVQLGLIKPTKGAGPAEVKSQADVEERLASLEAETTILRQQLADERSARANEQAAQAMRENTGDPDAQAPSVTEAESVKKAAAETKKRQAQGAQADQ